MKQQQWRQACAGVRHADKQCRAKFIPPSRRVKKDVWSGAKQLILSLWLEASFADTDFPWQVHFKRGWNAAQPGPARPVAGMMDRQTLCFSHQTAPLGVCGAAWGGGAGESCHFFFFITLSPFFWKLKQSNVPHVRRKQVHKGGKSKERENVNAYAWLCAVVWGNWLLFSILIFGLPIISGKEKIKSRSAVSRISSQRETPLWTYHIGGKKFWDASCFLWLMQ